MSSKHVDTGPQQPPVEHLDWALNWNTGKEHVTFTKFVTQFKFYNRTDAHLAYCCLLNSGKVGQQRLKNIQMEYEQFKKNKDDLFWSKRLKDKSTAIVLNNASVIVQEASLKQVNSNIQQHLGRHGLNNPKTDGQNRRTVTTTEISEDDMENHLLHGAEESEEGDDDEVVALVNKTSDGALSEVIDTDVIRADRSSITLGTSLPGTASLTQNYRQGAERSRTVVLEVTGNSSNSDGDELANAMNAHSHDQDMPTRVERLPDTDGEANRDQEAEGCDDDDDDELGGIILPHDFHGLFECLYRAANNQAFMIPKMPKMDSMLKMTLFQYVADHLTVYQDLPRVQQKDL
ncbi:hypothetical protein BGZ65_002409 [Modicella reniformis]|uniref:Uncharacterized protein n=1 Tax=Modicella reniformis TaxID=1440133 RepID=A0A9P6MIL1_9FUNG|nr:hypothetical protein BGZ65_002409 [Modicella reniformis]